MATLEVQDAREQRMRQQLLARMEAVSRKLDNILGNKEATPTVDAHRVFDERLGHLEANNSHMLHVTVSHVFYPVTEEVLHQVFDAFGAEKVYVHGRVAGVEALILFRSCRDAVRAREALHDRCIYDNCCWLDIQYEMSHPTIIIPVTPAKCSTPCPNHSEGMPTVASTSATVVSPPLAIPLVVEPVGVTPSVQVKVEQAVAGLDLQASVAANDLHISSEPDPRVHPSSSTISHPLRVNHLNCHENKEGGMGTENFETSGLESSSGKDVRIRENFNNEVGDAERTSRGGIGLIGRAVVEPAPDKADTDTVGIAEVDGSYLCQIRFDQCAISPLSLKGVKDAGYERMTEVQEATLPIILQGKDVLAKAKTGTGKTIAFLLPMIEVLSALLHSQQNQLRPSINLLVTCPMRELANQVAVEARKLLKYHRSLGVQVVIGGTRLTQEQRNMQANPRQILVITPGRLKDHLENTPGFSTWLKGVRVLVLDEADRLLDMGFRRDIENIIASIPRERQTLLFSAIVPEEVSQMYMVLHFAILYDVLNKHVAEDPEYKVIISCTTAMVTKLVAEVLSQLRLNIREINSRKLQSARTKIGIPADREQYIHRLGRTGRKGKEGQGLLLLAPWEKHFLSSVKDLSISDAVVPSVDSSIQTEVKDAVRKVEMKSKESAYQAWLGYYNSNKIIGRDKSRLVKLAEEFSLSMGLAVPPAIPKLILRKMGLNNVPGLRST